MEDFLGILAIIIYLIAAASGKKRKAKKKLGRQKGENPGFEQAFEARVRAEREREAQPAQEAPALARMAAQQDCGQQRMHLHEVTQQQMGLAEEGEDPCHAGGAPEAFSYDEEEAVQNGLAQDILRGVIMSEILTRPCDRAALRRNRRSAV